MTKGALDTLSTIRLFSGLNHSQLLWLNARIHTQAFPEHVDLVIEGEPGEVVYFILSGTVKVFLPQLDGSQVTVNIEGPGDMIGELSAIDQAGRAASVVTLEPTQTVWMSREHFLETLRTLPPANENLLRLLVERVRRTTELVRAYAVLDVPGRIIRQLLTLADQYGHRTQNGIYIPLCLMQNDIAELVGSSRKRANQVMVALRREGLIVSDTAGHITQLDPGRLINSLNQ